MTSATLTAANLYQASPDRVEFVDVPEMAFASITGAGGPADEAFPAALHALYAVSYGAHFLVKRRAGVSTRVRPLEALWWVDDPAQQEIVAFVAAGSATMDDTDRACWRWQAMIAQPEPIDADDIVTAADRARAKVGDAVDLVRFIRWTEGPSAQLMHVGPYAEEARSVARLHAGIRAAGYLPTGRHHEIYLGDPRRSAPERLRTILRQPVAAAS